MVELRKEFTDACKAANVYKVVLVGCDVGFNDPEDDDGGAFMQQLANDGNMVVVAYTRSIWHLGDGKYAEEDGGYRRVVLPQQ